MRYVVYGAGAVGGGIGGKLAQAGKDVVLIARGDHLRAMQADGLRLRTPREDVRVPVVAVGATHTYTRSAAILPKRGLRAAIEPHPPVRCAPGAILLMHITVRNISTELWPAQGNDDGTRSIRLGNHWRSRFGRMLREDDVRAKLPHDVAPGETVSIALRLEAPRKPGVYKVEFDMVQEHVQWFAAAGSQTRRTRVHVDAKMPQGQVDGLPPQMEMYGIPRRDVEALIARAGGILRAVDENDAPGPGWTSYWYISTR